jgi:hypothetical protein
MQDLEIAVQIINTLNELWYKRLEEQTNTKFLDIRIAVVTANVKQAHSIAKMLNDSLLRTGISVIWHDSKLKLSLLGENIQIYFLPASLADSPAVQLRGYRFDSYIIDDAQPVPDSMKYALATCTRRR